MLHTLLMNPLVHGVVTGILSAAVVDLHALMKFTSWTDFRGFAWGTASFRWFLGAVTGALTAAGYGALIG